QRALERRGVHLHAAELVLERLQQELLHLLGFHVSSLVASAAGRLASDLGRIELPLVVAMARDGLDEERQPTRGAAVAQQEQSRIGLARRKPRGDARVLD